MAAVVLMAAFAPAASGVTEQSQVRLAESVDENWRGAYDILVRPEGARSPLEDQLNLVEPNFLMFTGEGGLSREDLKEVRDVEGVEIAAPVSMIGYMALDASTPLLYLAKETIPAEPTLYRLRVKASTSDGYSEIIVDEQIHHVVPLPQAEREDRRWHSGNGSTELEWGTFIQLDPMQALSSPIVAIDPVAEERLLGRSADFLSALSKVGEQRDVSSFPIDLVDEESRFHVYLQLIRASGGSDQPVIPILTSRRIYSPLRLELSIQQVGDPIEASADQRGYGYLDSIMALRDGAKVTPAGSVSIDSSDALRPFETTSLILKWPGAEMPGDTTHRAGRFAQKFTAALPQPLAFEQRAHRPGSDAISLDAIPNDNGLRGLDTTSIGTAPDLVASPMDFPFLLAPVGEYDLAELHLPDNPLNWVPIGAYEAPETWMVANPKGEPVSPVAMNPTFDPAGLLQPPPLAITDLPSAEILRGEAPIDAIRVRVGGIERFDAASKARVEAVASSINALGMDVDVVAGSSPQLVELYWSDYHPDGTDLGWVEQRWSTLGAAEEVASGLSRLNQSILLMGVFTAIAGIAVLQMTRSTARRAEVNTLLAMGWKRRHIVWWLSSDGVVGGAFVAGVGAAASLALGLEPAAMAVVSFAAAALAGSSILGALLTSRHLTGGGQGVTRLRIVRTPRPAGVTTYALRALIGRPVPALTAVVCLAVAASGASLILVSVVGAASEAGPTLLAEFGAAQLRGYQVAMLAITVFAGVGAYLLVESHDISSRRDELTALQSLGLRNRTIRGLLLRQRLMIGIGAALLAGFAGYGFANAERVSLSGALLAAAIALLTAIRPTAHRHLSQQ